MMMPDFDDLASPAEIARMLALQAELLALNAAIESARGGDQSAHLFQLAEEARSLARSGREAAERHERLERAQEEVGRLLDEGLAQGPINVAGAGLFARLQADSAVRMNALAARVGERLGLPH